MAGETAASIRVEEDAGRRDRQRQQDKRIHRRQSASAVGSLVRMKPRLTTLAAASLITGAALVGTAPLAMALDTTVSAQAATLAPGRLSSPVTDAAGAPKPKEYV